MKRLKSEHTGLGDFHIHISTNMNGKGMRVIRSYGTVQQEESEKVPLLRLQEQEQQE